MKLKDRNQCPCLSVLESVAVQSCAYIRQLIAHNRGHTKDESQLGAFVEDHETITSKNQKKYDTFLYYLDEQWC